MPQPARVLCIMDLSVTGRAGLSAVVPVLSACGVQACGLPAALFSAHTGGFGPVCRQGQAAFGYKALAHYAREDIPFDAVYVGYLYGSAQFALARRALAQYPDALHLVDPAMADHGKTYKGIGKKTVGHMQALCGMAQLITPNVTESALLCGEDPALPGDEATAERRLQKLAQKGRSVVITSVPTKAGGYTTMGCEAGGKGAFSIESHHLPQNYPGTGDAFTAAVCGKLMAGKSLEQAARDATAFVEVAVRLTYEAKGEPRHGLWFERALCLLAEGAAP